MKNVLIAVGAMMMIAMITPSCSSSDDPAGTGSVSMNAELDNSEVSRVAPKGNDRVEGQSRSVTIDRVRILISRLKFKQVEDDTAGGRDIKTGPAIIAFADDTVTVVFNEPVPVGTYDRVKLEKHKFSSSEAEQYKNDATFGEFASPERLTIIIEGSYTEGTTEGFVIQDDATENLWVDFPTPLEVVDGGSAAINIVFDAEVVFKSNGVVLNPFEDKDRRDIFKNLQKAFRLQNRD